MKALVVLASILFPGYGAGLVARPRRMALWLVLTLATIFGVAWTVWCVPLAVVARLAAAVDGVRCVRREARPGGTRRPLAALAIVAGAVGFGYAQLELQALRIPSSSMYPTLVIGDHIYVERLSLLWRPIARGEVIVDRYPCNLDVLMVKRVVGLPGDTIELRCNVLYVNGSAVPSVPVAGACQYLDQDADGKAFPRACTRTRETLDGRAYEVFHDPGQAEHPRDFPSLDRPFPPSCNQAGDAPRGHQADQPHGTLVTTKPDAGPCEPQLHFVVPPGGLFGLGDNRDNSNDSRYWGVIRSDDVVGRVVGVWLSTGPEGGWHRFGAIH